MGTQGVSTWLVLARIVLDFASWVTAETIYLSMQACACLLLLKVDGRGFCDGWLLPPS